MGIFAKSSSAKKLIKKIDEEYWWRFNKVRREKSFNDKQKKILLVVLTSAKVLAWSLVRCFTHPEYDLSEHIDEKSDPPELFLCTCYLTLSDLKSRLKNKPDLFRGLELDSDWITATISDVLEIDRSYLKKLFEAERKMRKENIDPRDLWLEQEMCFYEKILKRGFDFRKHIKDDFAFSLILPMLSTNARLGAINVFDEALNIKTNKKK